MDQTSLTFTELHFECPQCPEEQSIARSIKLGLENQWPEQKFKIISAKTGQAVWEAWVRDGNQFAVHIERSGYSDQRLAISYNGYQGIREGGRRNDAANWLPKSLGKLEAEISKRQPTEHPEWTKKNISPEQTKELTKAINAFEEELQKQTGYQIRFQATTTEEVATGCMERQWKFTPNANWRNYHYKALFGLVMNVRQNRFEFQNDCTTNEPDHKTQKHTAQNVAELIEILETFEKELPRCLNQLPPATRALVTGNKAQDECYSITEGSAKLRYEADCSADAILTFEINAKNEGDFNSMTVIHWLDSGNLQKIIANLPRTKRTARHHETEREVSFPDVTREQAINAEYDSEGTGLTRKITLRWVGDELDD